MLDEILALFQLGIAALIVSLFFWFTARGFTDLYIHPADKSRRPYKLQRVKIRNTGETTDYVPRINIWAGLILMMALAICWFVAYRHFGLLILR